MSPFDPFGFDAQWGYYADREIGTYYCQARNYAPGQGRWWEPDPAGRGGGMNLYSYCAGEPVGALDHNGLEIEWAIAPGSTGLAREVWGWLVRIAGESPTGREIARDILYGKTKYRIVVDSHKSPDSPFGSSYDEGTHIFHFSNRDVDGFYWTDTDGMTHDFTYMRVVAHEIGHTRENPSNHRNRPDDPGGEQDNVDKYENPISAELGDKRKRGPYEKTGKKPARP